MPPVIVGVVAVVALVVVVFLLARRRPRSGAPAAAKPTVTVESGRLRPAVAEFHVAGGSARVHFEVPLPAEGADEVLAELLGREAVEVVREKRHTLPLGELIRVVALGRRGTEWAEVTSIGLATPGELPPPMLPELIPHASQRDFDPFDRMSGLPESAPGLAGESRTERLERLALRLPGPAQTAMRAQGIDPARVDAPTAVLALMRSAGYVVTPTTAGTFRADRAGQTTLIRVVGHTPGDYPELEDAEIRRFVVDFAASGQGRGLLLSEKWAPFEIHERERRDPRVRFVTRERLQAFADALAIG